MLMLFGDLLWFTLTSAGICTVSDMLGWAPCPPQALGLRPDLHALHLAAPCQRSHGGPTGPTGPTEKVSSHSGRGTSKAWRCVTYMSRYPLVIKHGWKIIWKFMIFLNGTISYKREIVLCPVRLPDCYFY